MHVGVLIIHLKIIVNLQMILKIAVAENVWPHALQLNEEDFGVHV